MKKLTLTFLASLVVAATSFAGAPMKESKAVVEPCFRAGELQLDIFGSYSDSVKRSDHGDGFGGGLGVNYFVTNNLGFGVSGNLSDGDVNGFWNIDADVILRAPFEGSICWAPYVLAGGGITTNGGTYGSWHAGGGLEWRVTHTIGLFGEGRYIWAEEHDVTQIRAGLRFVF